MDPITFNEIKYFPIPDHDKYYISQCGNVLSVKSPSGRYKEGKEYRKILTLDIDKDGYRTIHLRVRGKKRIAEGLHLLLAMTFLPDFSPKLQVDHKDNNKINNDLSNLRMVTRSENERNKLCYTGVCNCYDKRNNILNYRCSWYDELGLKHYKSFSCNKYGNEIAYLLARKYRDEMVKLYYNRPE
jgi:hypothetical protein